MLTMHSTLLIGPYDWVPERIPKEEFIDRIKTFWGRVSDATCYAAVVYGDSRNHAELAYLSHFTPKLGPALMLIPRDGEPALLASGAPNMLAAARRLTWIEKTQPLGDAGKTVSRWLQESVPPRTRPRAALIGGEAMRSVLRRSLLEAFGADNPLADETSSLRMLMRYKRPAELALIREACAILSAATSALKEAQSSGAGVTAAVLEAERVAYHSGAQDVRMLFSLDGGRTLRPFEALIDHAMDAYHVYLAVRHLGYWTEGFVVATASRHPALEKAADALKAILAMAKPGAKCRDLAQVVVETIRPYGEHSITRGNIGNSLGLFLEEEPRLLADSEGALEAGCVYSLLVGASDGRQHHALVSAVIAVHSRGADVLWSAV